MHNIYDIIKAGLTFNKFEINDLMLVEYTCPIEDESAGLMSHCDYIVHVLSGKKTWYTPKGKWTVSAGETAYIKKGACIIDQHFDDAFCMLGFFISDDFIRNALKEITGPIRLDSPTQMDFPVIRVNLDITLQAYFQTMLTFFHSTEKPANSILILKLKEFIFNIISKADNPELAKYFQFLSKTNSPSIEKVMDENFCFNLSLDEYARLSHRSLSSFKRDFKKIYNISPGKWLLSKRLDYSSVLLNKTNKTISEIVFECGFEDLSHFSRTFKERFGIAPNSYRKELSL